MRRRTRLFVVAIFVVLCFSVFLMMDSKSPSDSLTASVDSEVLAKLSEIEREIAAHDRLVADVRKALADAGSHGPEGRIDTAVAPLQAVTSVVALATVENVRGGMCTLADKPVKSSNADVQMMSVYNILPFDNPDGGVWKQGYDISYSAGQWTSSRPLNVVVVPHTHNDPGWIKTFERYFIDQTRAIHTLMVPKLEQDVRRKFIYAEISYFSLWWSEQTDDTRNRVRHLIENGQLEIVTGGWVMTDEANADHYAMIDQLIEGHEWLQNNFGSLVKPRSGWAVDPFGYSPTMAYVLKRAGFDNMLIQRVHYSIKKHLSRGRQLEFMWRQSWDAVGETDIFCHMMPFYSYDIPHTCGPEPAVCCQFDFKRLPGSKLTCPWKIPPVPITDANVRDRANLLLDQYRKKAQLYRDRSGTSSAVVLAPLGDDFRYDEASEWDAQYGNYQKLFDHMNSHGDLHVKAQFGTLSDYFDAVRKDAAAGSSQFKPGGAVAGFPILSGDFFTYADRDDHYWSGYFTSRPFYKHANRMLESHLRAAEVLYSIARSSAAAKTIESFPADALMARLVSARRNLALFHHHDGITGTAREHVVVDYGQRLLEAWQHTRKIMEGAAYYLLSPSSAYRPDSVIFDSDEERQNQDSLPTKKVLNIDSPRKIVLYNSLSHARHEIVRLHVSSPHVVVRDFKGRAAIAQVSPFFPTKDSVSGSTFVLDFVAEMPAIGLVMYTIEAAADSAEAAAIAKVELYNFHGERPASSNFEFKFKDLAGDGQIRIGNAYTEASFTSSGLLQAVTDKLTGRMTSTALEFVSYRAANRADQRSGAYLFLPEGPAEPLVDTAPLVRVISGPLLSEVHSQRKLVEHIVRLPHAPGTQSQGFEIENIVDITSESNFEIAMRLVTGIDNANRDFYTDLNGFQIPRRRTLDKLPLQANVYPMSAAAFIEDSAARVTLLSAEGHGVASLQKGWLDVFMDRRLMQDDGRGMNEPVKDNKRTRSLFSLVVEHRQSLREETPPDVGYLSPLASSLMLYLHHRPFVTHVLPSAPTLTARLPTLSGSGLSCDVHLLNVRTQQDGGGGSGLEVFRARRSAYVIVQRLAFDCSWPARALQCATSTAPENLSVKEILPVDRVQDVRSVSLTGLHDYGRTASISVPAPMHISTYRVAY